MRMFVLALTVVVAAAHPGPTVVRGGERVDVLIQFRSAPTAADVAALERLGGNVSRVFRIVPAVAASVPSQATTGLAANPRVTLIEPDSLLWALEYRSTHDWGIGHINADDVHRQTVPNRGGGVTVAVLDSGIDCDHLELPQDRCDYGQALGENFVDPSLEAANEADDDYGHGTHVAGTIAASLNQATGGVVGVSPDAGLVALKTLDSSGSGSWSRHIAAIEHVWNGGAPLVDIVNMSIGRGDYSSTAEIAMQRAYESGILLVAAAGNSGKCSGRGTNIAYPALFESVVAVAAIDSSNGRPCWSSTGDKVELTAPGVSVFSTWPKDMSSSYRDPQPVCEDVDGDGMGGDCHYKYGSGTSMSSPHVAGTAALVLASGIADADGLFGHANEVRARLAQTAVDLGTAGRDPQYGHGLVNAAAAVGVTDPGGGGDVIELVVIGSKVQGQKLAALSWTDGSASPAVEIDVRRDGAVVATGPNDGEHTDSAGRGGGSHVYQVCHAGTTTCSNEVRVDF